MSTPFNWINLLGTISGVLNVILLLVGVVLAAVAYFKWKNKIALLGMIGFLLMFLLSCCSAGWGLADGPIVNELRSGSVRTYWAIRTVLMFLLNLASLVGLSLLVAAVWIGGKRGR